jgi:hypothetical protein
LSVDTTVNLSAHLTPKLVSFKERRLLQPLREFFLDFGADREFNRVVRSLPAVFHETSVVSVSHRSPRV